MFCWGKIFFSFRILTLNSKIKSEVRHVHFTLGVYHKAEYLYISVDFLKYLLHYILIAFRSARKTIKRTFISVDDKVRPIRVGSEYFLHYV